MDDVDVLIAGAGPIGLALAADLGRRGVNTLVVEKGPNEIGSAKMLEVSVRTMEFCRQLGIADKVRHWGFPDDWALDTAFVTSMTGYELGRVRIADLGSRSDSDFSPERGRPCPQTWFDPILQDFARTFPNVRIEHQCKLESFLQDDSGVSASIRLLKANRSETVRARYLVGCDGYASTVRDLLGIEVRGDKHIDWSMTIYLRLPEFSAVHDKKSAFRYVFVGAEGTWSFLSIVDGRDLWRLQLVGVDRERLQAADIEALIFRAVGRPVEYEIVDRTLWVRKRTVADRFRDGRVFLAGDSAHAHPPNGGLGMNTGIQDAFDLGWKLTGMLQGWGGPGLLDSYDCERRPAASRAVEVSLRNYRSLLSAEQRSHIETEGPAGDAARAAVGAVLESENQKVWQAVGVHLGYIYHPSPIVVPDDSEKPIDDTIGYVPTTFPGARAPHVWVAENKSIQDLFGMSFVLLDFGAESTAPFEAAAEERKVPFTVHRIDNPAAASLYARKLVLVRPDGHVAWRGEATPKNAGAVIDTVRGAGLNAVARRA